MAVEALNESRVQRLILVRPAVEAGEKLGFLPGDLTQKVDPYLRPLYDALYEMLGVEKVVKLLERTSSRSPRWPTCADARLTTRM
jgi:phosphate starvation-inducible PhoH-like protein